MKARFFYVYILECSDGTFYTGITNDLERRLSEHHYGFHKESYTYSRRPLFLKWYEIFQIPETAIAFEKMLKKWSHRKKQALIDDNWDRVKKLAVCLNETNWENFKREE